MSRLTVRYDYTGDLPGTVFDYASPAWQAKLEQYETEHNPTHQYLIDKRTKVIYVRKHPRHTHGR